LFGQILLAEAVAMGYKTLLVCIPFTGKTAALAYRYIPFTGKTGVQVDTYL